MADAGCRASIPCPRLPSSCILRFVFRNILFKGRSNMSITRVGATKQYSDGWDNIFGGAKSRTSTKSRSTKVAKHSAKKKSPKKSKRKAAKKSSRRK
jgi:hypothetical protein